MRKRLKHRLDGLHLGRFSALIGLTVFFAAGAIGGCCFAGLLGLEAHTHLSDYFNGYFTVLRDGEIVLPSLFSTIWELCRWHLFVLVLGFTALGVIGIPAVFFLRGFLLSFSVAVLIRLYGGVGMLAALAIFGACCLFALPALFILGVDGLRTSRTLAAAFWSEGKRGSLLQKGFLTRLGCCCILLAVGAAVQFGLAPALLEAAAGLMG